MAKGTVCSEIHTKQKACQHHIEFLTDKPGGTVHKVTTRLNMHTFLHLFLVAECDKF